MVLHYLGTKETQDILIASATPGKEVSTVFLVNISLFFFKSFIIYVTYGQGCRNILAEV